MGSGSQGGGGVEGGSDEEGRLSGMQKGREEGEGREKDT